MTRRIATAAGLIALAGGGVASAQVLSLQDSFGLHEAARLQQQRLSDQTVLQGLTAAQARLRTQQTLQGLELARPLPPAIPENYPGTSNVRRRSGVQPREAVPSAPEPVRPGLPADAATRGDLPL